MNRHAALLSLACAALAGEPKLPLPEAPVRVVIPDVKAFDAALTGAYRRLAVGSPKPGDPLLTAWRQSQVGSKLQDQWGKFTAFLPLNWDGLRKLQATSMGFALLEVGHLEAVLVLETPLAAVPASFPKGERKTHGGVAYTRVARSATDGADDPDRRMGLAFAQVGTRMILATSERALKLALDAVQAGRGLAPPLEGFVSMELDLDALRKDRYFRREFLFGEGSETGRIRAALRREGEGLVEVREGTGEPRGAVFRFAAPDAAAAGWEPEGTAFWPAFRRGLLEPVPSPADKPVPGLQPLPNPGDEAVADRYALDLTRPRIGKGEAAWEEGDLAAWKELLGKVAVPGWGWWVDRDGTRRLVFPWPESQDQALLDACRASVARRAGRSRVDSAGDTREIRIGAGFPVLALRRTGGFLWAAGSAKDLQQVVAPKTEPDLLRWAQVDLAAVRAEAPRWTKSEGPPRPELVRPLSDRVLGLLGWMPSIGAIAVERRRTASGWTETVHFQGSAK